MFGDLISARETKFATKKFDIRKSTYNDWVYVVGRVVAALVWYRSLTRAKHAKTAVRRARMSRVKDEISTLVYAGDFRYCISY